MQYGLQRYYKMWNAAAGPNWFIFDRTTGKKVKDEIDISKANDAVRDLNKKDREERGIKEIPNDVEVSSTYTGCRSHEPIAIEPMTIHK